MDIEQIREIIDDRLRRVNTCMPGKVETYDATRREATVSPQVDDKYANDEVLRLPVLTGVPVIQITTANAGLVLPIAEGDGVLVLFAQRSIDRWLSAGNRGIPNDIRMHSLSDPIAIAGLLPFSETHSDGDGLVLFNDLIKIRMDGNTIAIGTSLVELLDEIIKCLDELIISIPAGGGSPITQITASSAALKTIRGTI